MNDVADKSNAAASLAVSKGVTAFAHEASQARKFHRDTLGRDVDPEHCLGNFLQLVADRNDRVIAKRYGEYSVKAAMTESSGITGGYAVPVELRDDLMGDVAKVAIFRPRATVIPMASATLDLPYWDVTTATAKGVPPFWGGMSLSWLAEANALPENEPKLRQLSLKANVLGGTLLTSQPLLQDAVGLEAWLRKAFAGTLAWYEDYHGVNGTGVGQMLGLLNAGCKISVNRQTGGQYTSQDGQNMMAKLYDNSSADHSLWLFSQTVRSQRVSQANWWINGPQMQYGLGIADTFLQPALGTTGDVIAADLEMYIIGDRQIVSIEASPYYGTAFTQNQQWWRVVERIDGQPLLSAAITIPDGGSNTVSPVVILN